MPHAGLGLKLVRIVLSGVDDVSRQGDGCVIDCWREGGVGQQFREYCYAVVVCKGEHPFIFICLREAERGTLEVCGLSELGGAGWK